MSEPGQSSQPPPPPHGSPPLGAGGGGTALAPPRRAPAPSGRRYGFLCSYCSSRLEAMESQAGQSGACPTCGNSVVIPILDYRGRLIDPTSGQVIKQDPHPVHAYAAAGHKAPQIIPADMGSGAAPAGEDRVIKCPRCEKYNSLASNNCKQCGLPFTMEGTSGDAVSGTNTWAVASLVLGIVSVACGFLFIVPPPLAVIFGAIAMRNTNQSTGETTGQGLAIAGMVLGTIGTLISVIWYTKMHIF